MTEKEELSADTMSLVESAVNESDSLSRSDSLDDKLSHLARTYLIAERYGSAELSEKVEEYTDTQAEAEAKQERIKEKIRRNV